MANGKPSGIIMTRTPLRISFAGGGTDLAEFYEHDYGAVLSTAIDKYLYVTVKRHGDLFNERYRLNYSETEHVNALDEIRNAIGRECLRFLDVEPPVYISTVADLPAFSGLGSSSSFAVGLLHALHVLRGERVSAGQLAEEAAHIEIDMLRRPIGKQDHYAAAFGGLNYIRFSAGGRVTLEPQRLPDGSLQQMFTHTLLFWTGIGRDAESVLSEQRSNIPRRLEHLSAMREQADALRGLLQRPFDPTAFGGILDEGWRLKRELAGSITNDRIDAWYRQAMEAGAAGGKLCGAGGGGFLLFVVRPERQRAVRQALADLTEVPVGCEARGSSLLFPFGE